MKEKIMLQFQKLTYFDDKDQNFNQTSTVKIT